MAKAPTTTELTPIRWLKPNGNKSLQEHRLLPSALAVAQNKAMLSALAGLDKTIAVCFS